MEKVLRYPKVLYKYRDWRDGFHKKNLSHNEVFFASPSSLNDPFDCKIPIRFDKANRQEAFKMALRIIKHEHPTFDDEEHRRLAKEVVEKEKWKDPINIEAQTEFQRQKINRDFGVCSFSKRRNINLVWTHYGAHHYGFCIGLNITHLIDEIKNRIFLSTGLIIDPYPVNYVKKFPYIDAFEGSNVDNLITVLTTKAIPWKYENEFRLILINGTNQAVRLSDHVIEEVIFGIRMKDDHKEEIIQILKTKKNKVQLFQAKLAENSFKILFDKISY